MPIPSPKPKEQQQDFISRCMGDAVMNKDYADRRQRAAVCYSSWRKSKDAQALKFDSLMDSDESV